MCVFPHSGINTLQKSSTSQNNWVKLIDGQPFEKIYVWLFVFFHILQKVAYFSYPELRLVLVNDKQYGWSEYPVQHLKRYGRGECSVQQQEKQG